LISRHISTNHELELVNLVQAAQEPNCTVVLLKQDRNEGSIRLLLELSLIAMRIQVV